MRAAGWGDWPHWGLGSPSSPLLSLKCGFTPADHLLPSNAVEALAGQSPPFAFAGESEPTALWGPQNRGVSWGQRFSAEPSVVMLHLVGALLLPRRPRPSHWQGPPRATLSPA